MTCAVYVYEFVVDVKAQSVAVRRHRRPPDVSGDLMKGVSAFEATPAAPVVWVNGLKEVERMDPFVGFYQKRCAVSLAPSLEEVVADLEN
jgi:hypothetical protein